MKLKRIFMSAALLAGCLFASAQEPQAAQKATEAFVPHWYVQGQIGGQYTLGEVDFGDLLSGNVQVGAGYNFTPVWGLRFSLNAWQSKGGTDLSYDPMNLGVKTWNYKYIAPTLDVTCDLTNWILGYKPNRVCNFGLLAGLGLNFAWDNDEAAAVHDEVAAKVATFAKGTTIPFEHQMTNLWDGTTTRVVGRFGAYLDFNVSRRVALGLEANCNMLSDSYNSKDARNADWYFNALAGIKVRLGKLAATPVQPIVVEKIVEKPVEKIVEKIVEVEKPVQVQDPMRRDIFFTLRGSDISRTEMAKLEDVANYLKKYPNAKVSVTGYADRGTGNPQINVGYARKRAEAVTDVLTNKFGISSSRITMDSKGDTVQPYDKNDLNRVTICIAQ